MQPGLFRRIRTLARVSPSPWLASLLSALIPGLGHIYAGDRRRGRVMLAVDLALIALLAVVAVFLKVGAMKVLVSPDGLSLVMAGNLLLASYRLWAAYDAHGLVAGRRRPRSENPALARVALLAVAFVLVVPHAAVGYLTVTQYSLLRDVFDNDPSPTVPTTPGSTVPGQTTTTDRSRPPIWDGLERLNVLLIGSDVGPDRTGIRTDTMIVVSVDPQTGDAAMISLPRNLHSLPLPEGFGPDDDCHCFPDLLNALWWDAVNHPDRYPGEGDPGPRALKRAIGEFLGLEIQYYAMVSLQGFVGLVDALGGVTIDVPARVVDETYPHEDGVTIENVVIEPGRQHLDGHLALAYARIRRHADDWARMNRQRCVLGALLEQSSPMELLARYGALVDVMRQHLETDIPLDRLADFIDILPKLSTDRIGALLVNRDYVTERVDNKTFYDLERIQREAAALLADPTSGATDGLSLSGACD